ncbi:hypothetical protein [Neochlamydia sp. AcF65]|nr:hypothetical protein [Neochlamydia sp. AcF65]
MSVPIVLGGHCKLRHLIPSQLYCKEREWHFVAACEKLSKS